MDSQLSATIKCPSGHSNSAAQRFCGKCGSPLTGPDGTAGLAAPSIKPAPRVGATFTTTTGQHATIRGINGNDVWLDVKERDGRPMGTVRFPLTAVEAALAERGQAQRAEPAAPMPLPPVGGATAPLSPELTQNQYKPVVASPQPRYSVRRAAGIAAVLVAFGAGIAIWLGHSPRQSPEAIPPGDYGTDPSPRASTLDDWLSAVCKPGTFRDGNNRLPNAQAGGTCTSLSANGMPIFMGQYSSKFGMESDIAIFRMRSYATLLTDSGRYQVFIALGRESSALQPLVQYGFGLGVAG